MEVKAPKQAVYRVKKENVTETQESQKGKESKREGKPFVSVDRQLRA